MPCTYYETKEEEEARVNNSTKYLNGLKKELNRVTNLLCSIMTKSEELFNHEEVHADMLFTYISTDKNIQNWWQDHKNRDKIALEKLKEEALKKLSYEEKKALGLPVNNLEKDFS